MANKIKSIYVCSQCGYQSAKWAGKCPDCNEWNTFEEQIITASGTQNKPVGDSIRPMRLSDIGEFTEHRYDTGISELNRVLGGGLVKGSVVLLSGDPGIGKSTLLLQTAGKLCLHKSVLYVSGEESAHQLKLRALRIGNNDDNLIVVCDNDACAIGEYIKTNTPDIVIIDSIQTMSIPELNSLPGSITQVRECSNLFMRVAKTCDIPIIIVGHVNKDGNIAGPKVLEHIVDCVLYFEGEKNLAYRILRAVKNRFGSTNEIGVFEMIDRGLREVPNPSKALISGKPSNVSGSCIASVMEGSRPILAEVQGLVSQTAFGNPRRMSTGFDYNRMSLLVAVLEKRSGYFMGNCDIYVNVAGGLRIDEPASDLPVALTLISSLKDEVISDDCIAFGEIGLAGEIRSVSFAELRIKEAIRLGFKKCIISEHNLKEIPEEFFSKINIIGVNNIRSAYYEAIMQN